MHSLYTKHTSSRRFGFFLLANSVEMRAVNNHGEQLTPHGPAAHFQLAKMSFLASSCAVHSSFSHLSIRIDSVGNPSSLGGALPSIAL